MKSLASGVWTHTFAKGLITNILTGYLIAVVPGQPLILAGLLTALVCLRWNAVGRDRGLIIFRRDASFLHSSK